MKINVFAILVVIFLSEIHAADFDKFSTTELLDAYLISGDPRPENEALAKSILSRKEEIVPLLRSQVYSRESVAELLMIATLAPSIFEPDEAENIVSIVRDRVRPDAEFPLHGSNNPLIPSVIGRCFVAIENRRNNNEISDEGIAPTSSMIEDGPYSEQRNEQNHPQSPGLQDQVGKTDGALSRIALTALICAVLVLVIFGIKKMGGGKSSAGG